MSPTAAFSHSHWGLQLLSRSLYTMLRKPPCPSSQCSRVLTSALPPTCYVTLSKAHPLCGPNFEVSKKEGLPRMLSEACAHLVILTVPHRWMSRARTGGHIRLEIWKGKARGRNATKQKCWKGREILDGFLFFSRVNTLQLTCRDLCKAQSRLQCPGLLSCMAFNLLCHSRHLISWPQMCHSWLRV